MAEHQGSVKTADFATLVALHGCNYHDPRGHSYHQAHHSRGVSALRGNHLCDGPTMPLVGPINLEGTCGIDVF